MLKSQVIRWFYPNVQSDVFIESGNRVAASAMAGHKFFDENNEPVQDAAEVELKKSGSLENTDLESIEFAYDFKAHSIDYYPKGSQLNLLALKLRFRCLSHLI